MSTTQSPAAATVQDQVSATIIPVTQRLMSLDVFRGATIAAMMMVNNAGDWRHIYTQLEHSEWHGWTFTDTVFPSFLWIVGVAMTLSFAKRMERGDNRTRLLMHTVKRAAIIFGVGVLLNGFPFYHLATIRIPGVLQRIAVCYLIAGAIFLYTRFRTQVAITVGLLVGYWLLMMLVPVPGLGAGHLEMGHNLEAYVDRLVIPNHLYGQTKTWDPEGIVSTLPAIATTMFGIFAGYVLRLRRQVSEKAAWLFLMGNVFILSGLMMNVWLPINKKLWTSSFAVFMAGLAAVVFAGCYWLVDAQGHKSWTKPFAIYGMNAIALYMLSSVIETLLVVIKIGGVPVQRIIYQNIFAPLADPYTASMLYGMTFSLMMFGVAYFMYRRNWIVKF